MLCSRTELGQGSNSAQMPFKVSLLEHVKALDNFSSPNVLSSNVLFSLPTQKPHAQEATAMRYFFTVITFSITCYLVTTAQLFYLVIVVFGWGIIIN